MCVKHFENRFYILANRLNFKLGQFLFYIDEDISTTTPEKQFVYKQDIKLKIADGSIDIIKLEFDDIFQIVSSFKTMDDNNFIVYVAQRKMDETNFKIMFKYSGY